MRPIKEIEAEREHFRQQALEYRSEKQRPEAWLRASIVSTLDWVLGKTSAPTVRAKLD